MSEMLERVTRAITDKLNATPEWMADTSILGRAAIEAMRPDIEAFRVSTYAEMADALDAALSPSKEG